MGCAAVLIPQTSGLSSKELRQEATALGMDCSWCLERSELLAAYKRAKQVRQAAVLGGIETESGHLLLCGGCQAVVCCPRPQLTRHLAAQLHTGMQGVRQGLSPRVRTGFHLSWLPPCIAADM